MNIQGILLSLRLRLNKDPLSRMRKERRRGDALQRVRKEKIWWEFCWKRQISSKPSTLLRQILVIVCIIMIIVLEIQLAFLHPSVSVWHMQESSEERRDDVLACPISQVWKTIGVYLSRLQRSKFVFWIWNVTSIHNIGTISDSTNRGCNEEACSQKPQINETNKGVKLKIAKNKEQSEEH